MKYFPILNVSVLMTRTDFVPGGWPSGGVSVSGGMSVSVSVRMRVRARVNGRVSGKMSARVCVRMTMSVKVRMMLTSLRIVVSQVPLPLFFQSLSLH